MANWLVQAIYIRSEFSHALKIEKLYNQMSYFLESGRNMLSFIVIIIIILNIIIIIIIIISIEKSNNGQTRSFMTD